MAAVGGDPLQPQAVEPGMVVRIAARGPPELGLDQRQPSRPGRFQRPLERGRAASVVDRGAEALELVGGRMVQSAADKQPVERELEVEGADAPWYDGDPEVLLQRRSRPEAEVVVGTE